MFREPGLSKLKRMGCGGFGVVAIAFGLFHSQSALSFSYRNWFGGLVSEPIVAVFGVVALLAAVCNWRRIWDSPPADDTRK